MAQLTMADLKELPSSYESPRDVGDVLIGEDTAHPLIEAASSGNDAALQDLLSQPQWTKTMLEQPHCIYYASRPSQGPNDVRTVSAMHMSNLERALTVAAQNGHVVVVSTLLAFATHQGIDTSKVMTRSVINKTIKGGHGAVFKAFASADPNVVNFDLPHGTQPLYEAARLRKSDVFAVLLELGADPLHPVASSKEIGGFNSSLMSRAAFAEDPRMVKLLLDHGVPIALTGALHTAARCSHFDTMRLFIKHGADLNEVLPNSRNWTPMHFAAWRGKTDAMEWLEQNGARSDLKDKDGKIPAQVLDEYNTA